MDNTVDPNIIAESTETISDKYGKDLTLALRTIIGIGIMAVAPEAAKYNVYLDPGYTDLILAGIGAGVTLWGRVKAVPIKSVFGIHLTNATPLHTIPVTTKVAELPVQTTVEVKPAVQDTSSQKDQSV